MTVPLPPGCLVDPSRSLSFTFDGREYTDLHAEVCVVGGGPSGLAAANAAAEAGADVILLERQTLLGGRLLYEGRRVEDVPGLRLTPASNADRRRTLLDTTVFGLYEGNLL